MSHKQASLTLKEYLHQYLVARSPKASVDQHTKSMAYEVDCQKLFNRKLTSIKRLIKTLIKDSQAQGALEKELEELKAIFKDSRNLTAHGSKDINDTIDLSKNGAKKFKKNNISIPVIPIMDDSLEDLRITNTAVAEEKGEPEPKIILTRMSISELKEHKQQNGLKQQIQKSIRITPKYQTDSKIKKGYSKQFLNQITPTFPKTTKNKTTASKILIFDDDCMPPALDRQISFADSIRNTRKSQQVTNENENISNR